MAYNPNNTNGSATSANSAPVVIASDQAAIPITDNAGSITVDGTVTANAGTGTMNVSVQNASIPVTGTFFQATQPVSGTVAATQSGTWNVGLNAGTNAVGSITNTSFAATQATASNLNATVVGTGTFAVQADTELPAAAALTDTNANPTTPIVGSALLSYNGTTWERIESVVASEGNGAIDSVGVLSVRQGAKRINPTALGTAVNSASTVDVNGAGAIVFGISSTTTGTFIFEGTADNTNWFNIEVFSLTEDLWVSGQSITPTLGRVYSLMVGSIRQVRMRTNALLGATVSHFITIDQTQDLIAGIDTGAAPHNFGYTLVHKDGEYTTAQTGTVIWTPTTGKKFAITDITISTGGTTAGIVTIFDAITATTTYTAGTTPAIFRASFVPSANSNPGVIKSFNVPYVSAAANNVVHVTTSAAMTVYIQLNGYEI